MPNVSFGCSCSTTTVSYMASILNKLQSIPPVIFLNSSPYITLWQWQSIPRGWLLNCLQSIAKMISIKTTIYYMFYLPANLLLSSLLFWARSWFPSANYILLTPSHSVFVATCLWLLSIFSLLWLSQSLLTEKIALFTAINVLISQNILLLLLALAD